MKRSVWHIIMLSAGCLLLVSIGTPRRTLSRVPAWTPADYPRLLASPAEKSAVTSKLTANGTISAADWSAFLVSNKAGQFVDYADGAFQYWVTGNTTAGQRSISAAKAYMAQRPDGVNPSNGDLQTEWWRYRDLLLTFDFAHDLLTSAEQQQFKDYMVLQSSMLLNAQMEIYPGNKSLKYALDLYAAGVLLEGENHTVTIIDEAVTRGTTADGVDSLRYIMGGSNIKINDQPNQPTADYTLGVDYEYKWTPGTSGYSLSWALSGAGTREPAPGAKYYVSYTVIPNLVRWKSLAKQTFEYTINNHWSDGYYDADLTPYGDLQLESIPYFVEILRRDTGVDYGRNDNLKRAIDMYLFGKLPSNPPGITRRFNTLNDSSSWTEGNMYTDAWVYPGWVYHVWMRPFVAWATTEYANDPEGYDQRYRWLWTQAYRNANGTVKFSSTADWREALWINNGTFGGYPVTNVPTPNWPKNRYFRGKEVVYTRTEDWANLDQKATLFNMVAGNHNYISEHDHGDAGSFTFYSLGEDWAIDPGYRITGGAEDIGTRLYDHNSVGIDGGGYNTSGIYGVTGSYAHLGGLAHFSDVALTDEASAMSADLANAWTLTSTPYVQRDSRYATIINSGQQPYLIVADDIQKDAGTHSYEWYMHTGIGNVININGPQATITGARSSSAKLDVYSLGPEAVTITQSAVNVTNIGSHPVLKARATGTTQARFFHLLIPSDSTHPAPTVVRTVVTNGIQAVVTWADGNVDTILWRYDGTTITSTSDVTSDARLTVTRTSLGEITGLAAVEGRNVSLTGRSLLTTIDGSAPITVAAFGTTAGLAATDTALVRIGLPFVTAASLEDGAASVPVTNDGAMAYINGGLSLAQLRRDNGILYHQDFNDQSIHDLYRSNMSWAPVEQFGLVNDALELRATDYEWPSFSKRDSTLTRRANIWPTMIPPVSPGDGQYTFRYRFTDVSGGDRKLQLYFRTQDRNAADWYLNQDYIRLDLKAIQGGTAVNQVVLGERVNGTVDSNGATNNDALTTTVGTVTASIADTNWHTAQLDIEGKSVSVAIDGQELISGALPTALTDGYMGWKVIGTSTVLLDDVKVTAIDHVAPVAPTGGWLAIAANGTGQLRADYGQGASTDADKLVLLESAQPIQSTDDSSTMKILATFLATETAGSFTGGDNNAYHALMVADQAGNESMLTPLSLDKTAPAAIIDLRVD